MKAPAKAPEPAATGSGQPPSLTQWVYRCFNSEEMKHNKDVVQVWTHLVHEVATGLSLSSGNLVQQSACQ